MTACRPATRDDLDGVTGALARAFFDDPVMEYFFPREDGRVRKIGRLMQAAAAKALRTGELWTTDDHTGAAVWSAPNRWKVRGLEMLREAPLMTVFGRRLPLAVGFLRRMEAAHPHDPHWYLAVLGTDPPRQGQGIGSALMAPLTERCDAEGIPMYLESSKESNVPFYERHGFVLTGEVAMPDGPTLWPMWREPRAPGS